MEKQVLQLKYVPFVKVDEERRWVYGRATDETLDVEGEVVDFWTMCSDRWRSG